uniref:Uncharacterized protein n=1 Tax=Meloidogyne enterolobii TaxID=390850 RepID=A0A6V7VX69_MELEN|nr:unnamed protein product [Meloidogyne enterolobii]
MVFTNIKEVIADILTLLSFQNLILTELKQDIMPSENDQLSNQLEGWNALPAETLSKIKMIKSDSALLPSQKQEQINALIDGLPDKVIDMIPDPPEFNKIPKELKECFKQIFRRKEKLSLKCKKADEMINTLPDDQKAIFTAFKNSIIVFMGYT